MIDGLHKQHSDREMRIRELKGEQGAARAAAAALQRELANLASRQQVRLICLAAAPAVRWHRAGCGGRSRIHSLKTAPPLLTLPFFSSPLSPLAGTPQRAAGKAAEKDGAGGVHEPEGRVAPRPCSGVDAQPGGGAPFFFCFPLANRWPAGGLFLHPSIPHLIASSLLPPPPLPRRSTTSTRPSAT